MLASLVAAAFGLAVADWLLPGFTVQTWSSLVAGAVALGVVGALVRPALLWLATHLGWAGALLLALLGNALVVALAEGDLDGAVRAFTRSAGAADEAGIAEVSVAAWHNQSRALHLLGRLDKAYEAAERARALAEQEGDVHRIAAVESHLADLLHAQGRSEEARALQIRSAQALAGVALPRQRPEVWLVADW